MPDDDKKEPRNDSRIVIETPLTAPKPVEKPDMDRYGRVNPFRAGHWAPERTAKRRITKRA